MDTRLAEGLILKGGFSLGFGCWKDPLQSLFVPHQIGWSLWGGRGTLVGPIIGAIGVNWLKSFATHKFPEFWSYILGGMFIFVVIFMPKGLVGIPSQLRGLIERRWRSRSNLPMPETSQAKTADADEPLETATKD